MLCGYLLQGGVIHINLHSKPTCGRCIKIITVLIWSKFNLVLGIDLNAVGADAAVHPTSSVAPGLMGCPAPLSRTAPLRRHGAVATSVRRVAGASGLPDP